MKKSSLAVLCTCILIVNSIALPVLAARQPSDTLTDYRDIFIDALNEARQEVGPEEDYSGMTDEQKQEAIEKAKEEDDKARDEAKESVENIQDVMVIENTQQFHGLYHVLGGIISPMDGIGPSDIEIDSLVQRVADGGIQEVILALSPTMEGDTTNFYIYRKLAGYDVKVSVIARGVAIGNELEYTDEVTLGRSITNRTLFEEK